MIRLRRKREGLRNNPEDGRSQSRSQSTSGSESEDEELFYPSRHRRTLKPLSDYETDASSDITNKPKETGIGKKKYHNSDSISPRQFSYSDSSSDNSVISPRKVRNHKRPLSPPLSTSDLSDSGVPVGCRRTVKRIKLSSSSESITSDNSSIAGDHNPGSVNELVRNPNNTIKINPTASHLKRNLVNGNSGTNAAPGPSIQGSRRRRTRIPVIESESESESDVLPASRITRGRKIPVIESEDDSSSSVEFPSRNSRIPSIQNIVSQEVRSVDVSSRRNRSRNVLSPQQNESSSTARESNSVRSTYNGGRRRQVVDSNTMSFESCGENEANETEEDEVSVSNGRRIIGRRIPVVESEDESDPISNTPNSEIFMPDQENEVISNLESNLNPVGRRILPVRPNNETNITPSYPNRLIPSIQSEDEDNTSDSDIRPRVLSNRLAHSFSSDYSSSTTSSSSVESDDSIPIRNPIRRNRTVPILDYDNEDSFDPAFDANIKISTVIKVLANQGVNTNSSDTDGESEKCPICLVGFKLQEIGKPTSCDHMFCSLCIKEWATKNNTCPVDRKVFNGIVVYDKIDGKVICQLPVEETNPQYNELDFIAEFLSDSSDDYSVYVDLSDGDGPEERCSVCGLSFRPHRMISCDSCNRVYHLDCIHPPLRDFPTVSWYCSDCEYSDTFSDSD